MTSASAILLACTALAAAPLSSPVQDEAALFSADEQAQLVGDLERLRADHDVWFVVHTVPTLSGDTIDAYAERYFRAHQIGQAGKDNGLLLVLAMQERKSRLEVGYGLEHVVTDARSNELLVNVLQPWMRQGQPFDGIRAVVASLRGEAVPAPPAAARAPSAPKTDDRIPLIWALLFVAAWSIGFAATLGTEHTWLREQLELLVEKHEGFTRSFGVLRVLWMALGLLIPAALYFLLLWEATTRTFTPAMPGTLWLLLIVGSLALWAVLGLSKLFQRLAFKTWLKVVARRRFGATTALPRKFDKRLEIAFRALARRNRGSGGSSSGGSSSASSWSSRSSSSSSYSSSSSSSSFSGGGRSGGGGASSGW